MLIIIHVWESRILQNQEKEKLTQRSQRFGLPVGKSGDAAAGGGPQLSDEEKKRQRAARFNVALAEGPAAAKGVSLSNGGE